MHEQRTLNLVNILIVIFSSTLLISGDSYKYAASILGIISLLYLPVTYKAKLSKEIKLILLSFSLYFLLTITSLIFLKGDLSNADMPSRAILGIIVFLFLYRYPPKLKWILWGIILGSIAAGVVAVFYHYHYHTRAFLGNGYMVIQAGNIAMSLGLFSLIAAFHFFKENKTWSTAFALIASMAAILASLLSLVRGSWIIAPIVLIGILIANKDLFTIKIQLVLAASILMLATLSYPIVEKRIDEAIKEVNTYLSEQKVTYTSTSARLELWKSGIYNVYEKPLFGTGYNKAIESKETLVGEGKVDKVALRFNRLHNNYLDEASTKGLLGLIVLLALFITPLQLFKRRYQSHKFETNRNTNTLAQLGITHIILVMGYCFTQNFINHHSGILFFLLFTIIFISAIYKYEQEALTGENK